MKIRYILPGALAKTELGVREIERRQEILRKWAFPGTFVDVVAVPSGPATIESMYEKYLSVPSTAKCVLEAEAQGFDAAIVGCFGDPGLDALRELSDMLVVGPASLSIAAAATLCHRFSIVTVVPGIMADKRRLAWEAGALDKLASVKAVDIPVIEVNKDPEGATRKMTSVCAEAVKEGAEAVVLGCMSMGFLDVADKIAAEIGVPVLNPVKVGLKMTESLVASGLHHSRKAYIKPKKMQMGMSVDDLYIK
jgi:allantoin racemase